MRDSEIRKQITFCDDFVAEEICFFALQKPVHRDYRLLYSLGVIPVNFLNCRMKCRSLS